MKTLYDINDENLFEWSEALYTWLSLNYDGQWSDRYRAMCSIDFKPGRLWSESRVEKENPYFCEINEDNWEDIFEAINSADNGALIGDDNE